MIVFLAAVAAAATCPSMHKGARLTAIDLFDGPLADQAILAPDTTRRTKRGLIQTWQVGKVYRDGRALNLRCQYATGRAMSVPLPEPVSTCRMTWNGRPLNFTCR